MQQFGTLGVDSGIVLNYNADWWILLEYLILYLFSLYPKESHPKQAVQISKYRITVKGIVWIQITVASSRN